MEEKIKFLSEDFEIEGLIHKGVKDKGVIVTHPHPLYGGDMYNMVVESIVHAYHKKGYTTLRFNFRGVGKSQGRYDNGIGEQKDIRAALAYLYGIGIKHIDLAGYSFGAWVNSKITRQDDPVEGMIMVSPPAGFIDFQPITPINSLKLVVTGESDEIAPKDLIEKMLPTWNKNARFEVIKGADHFYSGYLEQLESILISND